MAGLKTEDLREQLNWYSTSVSSSVRTTAFGVIAAIWAIFTADGLTLESTSILGFATGTTVKLSFVFASGALLADILQYVASYWMYSIGIDKHEVPNENSSPKEFFYNYECLGCFGLFLYRLGFVLFPIKLSLVILGAASFLLVAFSVTWSG